MINEKSIKEFVNSIGFYRFWEVRKKWILQSFIEDLAKRGEVSFSENKIEFAPYEYEFNQDLKIARKIIVMELAKDGIDKVSFYDNDSMNYLGEVKNVRQVGYGIGFLFFLLRHGEQLKPIVNGSDDSSPTNGLVVFEIELQEDGEPTLKNVDLDNFRI